MEELLKKIIFDMLAISFLESLDQKITTEKIKAVRVLYNYNYEKILSALIRIDEVRGIVERPEYIKIKKQVFNDIDVKYDFLEDT